MRSRRSRTRPFLTVAALALVLLATSAQAYAQRGPAAPNPGTIRLKAATFDPLAAMPALPDGLSRSEYGPEVRGSYLVQFDRPITAAHRSALENAGASVKGYVPMMTLEVVMTPASRAKVARLDGVRWVGVVQPAFKLYPGLEQDVANRFTPGDKVSLQVSLYPGEDEPGLSQVRGLGARILKVDRGRSFLVAEAEVPAARLQALARIPTVRYIELVYEPMAMNDRARVHTGMSTIANDTFSAGIDPSLDGNDEGSGFQVKYGHMDTGISIAHSDFSTATITFEPGADANDTDNGHGTHTSGSIVGDGGLSSAVPEGAPPGGAAIGPNQWRGVTPQAALHHISFDNGYSDRQMFERESEEGVHISSNSWGWSSLGQPITDYNTNAAMWDDGVWDADDDVAGLQPLTTFFSASNNGGWVSPYNGCFSSGPDTVGSPGTAKNVITVGNNETDRGAGGACGAYSALGDNIEEMNASSSRGPVDPDGTGQGLFKPDVTNIGGYWVASTEALGTASACSAQTVNPDCPTDCSDTGPSYAYQNGTSMSAPLTAGFGGMVLQDLVVNRGVATPRPSLMKAMLINGARDLTPAGCNYTFDVSQSVVHEGWGFVQAGNTLYGPGGTPSVRNIEFENEDTANALATGGSVSRQVTVAGGTPFKVSLAWTDYPAGAGSGSPLVVNDLDLEVSGPDGTFLGNNFSDAWSVTGGSADRYNVAENVYIQNPSGGTYTITVKGFQVSQDQEPGKAGVNQDYSLVWSGDLSVCTPTCGDNVAECGEVCDGTDLGGESCQSQGFDTGTLACNGTCDGFDTIACANFECGNGVREGSEECDGADLGGATCIGQGCTGGTPSCTGGCLLDFTTCSGCPVCDNDGVCETDEDCNNCSNDCISGTTPAAVCGNNICETADGEDCITCAADCNGKQNGKPANRYCCGNGGENPVGCGSQCDASGNTCTTVPSTPVSYCCGDTVCEGDESSANCAVDCGAEPFCGDGTCNGGETVCDCAVDCGSPTGSEFGLCTDSLDNDCDGPVDCADSDCVDDAACVGCSLGQLGDSCVDDADCCSSKCKGKSGAKTCK